MFFKKSPTQAISEKNSQTIQAVLPELLPKTTSVFIEMAQGRITQKQLLTQLNSSTETEKQVGLFSRFIALPAYYWLLISQSVVILPHLAHMPIWLVGYGLFSIVMQLPQVKQKFNKKHNLNRYYRGIQLTAFVFAVIGLWLTFGGFHVESGVAFLLLCLISKLWEVYQRRDAFIILNLSLFVCGSLFLLDQGLSSSLQALLAVFAVLMAFVTMNDDPQVNHTHSASTSSSQENALVNGNMTGSGRIRSVALLTGLSLPLMIVLFLFFPRLPPLWSLQLSSPQATTGISDSMSPGDFANLSQSTELAFRVEFSGKIPSVSDMYWRGLVFSDFDGITWKQNPRRQYWVNSQNKPEWFISTDQINQLLLKGSPIEEYQVTLEATNQQWLFALDYPLQLSRDERIDSNYSLTTSYPVTQQRRYQQSYQTGLKIGLPLSDAERAYNLKLPAEGNQQAKKMAQKLYQQAGNNPIKYISNFSNWINQSEFHYTLSPPPLGDNRIDEFLFNTQAGFCEHYSSSFVFMMRAVGIPARVVAGYQGGKLGRDGTSWEVRQMDAHAWAEVWLSDTGWTRIDPTSWVAPERVEKGMEALSNSQGALLFGDDMMAELSYRQYKMLQQIRRFSDQMSYYWDRDIVGYDNDKQSQSLLKWFNIKNWYEQLLTMVGICIGIMSMITFAIWWKRRQEWHIADRELIKLSKRLATQNEDWQKADTEGMLHWLNRLSDIDSLDSLTLQQIQTSYRRLRYGRLSELYKQNPKDKKYRSELNKLNELIKLLK